MIADRAQTVTRVLLHMIARHLAEDGVGLHEQIAELLSDEFNNVAQETMNEIRREDE